MAGWDVERGRWSGIARAVVAAAGMVGLAVASGAGSMAARAAAPPLDLLVVAPHPDDETIGAAGATMQALAKGQKVGVVVLTMGDAHVALTAVVAGKAEANLGPKDFEKASAHRQTLSSRAAARVGLPADALVFLGYPDSGLRPMYAATDATPFTQKYTGRRATYASAFTDYHSASLGEPAPYVKASVVSDLAEILAARRPTRIVVTLDTDRHPDHAAASAYVRDAMRVAGSTAELLGYLVHGDPPARPPDVRVVLTQAERERKRLALLDHQQGTSPVHDYLSEKHATAEEHFWAMASR